MIATSCNIAVHAQSGNQDPVSSIVRGVVFRPVVSLVQFGLRIIKRHAPAEKPCEVWVGGCHFGHSKGCLSYCFLLLCTTKQEYSKWRTK